MRTRRWLAAACVPLVLGTTAACAGSADGSTDGVRVVASTDVYGDLVASVAHGVPGVRVTSIIDDPSADPHSYEANARTQLAISRADLIVENGGGYDDFVDRLRRATDTAAVVLDAVTISGKNGPDLNEHVWYDFPTVRKVVDRIAAALGTADRAHAAAFRANARTLAARIATLERDEAGIAARHRGTGVAITEPVPLYLLQACGLVNRTPATFSAAVEEGDGVPTRTMRETLALFADHDVALLVYNAQTAGIETTRVRAAAQDDGIPVVPVTETLPAGKTYVSWMRANLTAIGEALR